MSDCVNVLKKTRPVDSDRVCRTVLAAVASLAAVTVVAMIIFIAGQGFDALSEVGIWEFLTGSVWRPYIGSYGAASLIAGTLMVTCAVGHVCHPAGYAVFRMGLPETAYGCVVPVPPHAAGKS